jgi:hypothetical protein
MASLSLPPGGLLAVSTMASRSLPGWLAFPTFNLFFGSRLRRLRGLKRVPSHFMKSSVGAAPLNPISVSRQWGAKPHSRASLQWSLR